MRPIDADKLEVHEQLIPFGNGMYESTFVVYKDDIDAQPTLDVQPKWIPCSERLPDAGKIVLVCGKMGGIYTAIYSKQRSNWDNGWWKLNSKSHRCDPKAWMPLPKRYGVE